MLKMYWAADVPTAPFPAQKEHAKRNADLITPTLAFPC